MSLFCSLGRLSAALHRRPNITDAFDRSSFGQQHPDFGDKPEQNRFELSGGTGCCPERLLPVTDILADDVPVGAEVLLCEFHRGGSIGFAIGGFK